jgi:hypothetical protein
MKKKPFSDRAEGLIFSGSGHDNYLILLKKYPQIAQKTGNNAFLGVKKGIIA